MDHAAQMKDQRHPQAVNSFNRRMTKLGNGAGSRFGRQPRECGFFGKLSVPRAARPPSTLVQRIRRRGSQWVLLSTVMNGDGGADASHKRRLENRLMVRRHDPYGSWSAWPES